MRIAERGRVGIELEPGQPCFEARLLNCTCTWLRGFHVGEVPEEWTEKIIWHDPTCVAPHDD